MLNTTWFNRVRKKQRNVAAHEAERLDREAEEFADPYAERTTLVVGDRVVVDPQQILHNLHTRMERLDLDPDTAWAPEEIMSMPEAQLMFEQFNCGEMVVTATAQYARRVLARWPAELVQHPYPAEARIEAFLDGPRIDPTDQDIARRVINRALATAEDVDSHPELDGLDTHKLVQIWIAVVFWYGIKSQYLNRWQRGELAD